jgi:hypothetical protein
MRIQTFNTLILDFQPQKHEKVGLLPSLWHFVLAALSILSLSNMYILL